jgi:3D (Asp-Asp-Asp) domain-containing protein
MTPLVAALLLSASLTYSITAYSPLDGVKGMDYSGDPTITASGRKYEPGVSVAAPKHIPFGTWLWIEGLGWRRVDDRGKRIKGMRLDIGVHSREEALRWGIRRRRVYVPK